MCVCVCISIWTTHYFNVTRINKTSECILQTLCDDPVIGLKMSQESSTVTLEEDFADFQPYLPVLVIGMSCPLCPVLGNVLCVPAASCGSLLNFCHPLTYCILTSVNSERATGRVWRKSLLFSVE